MNAPEYAPSSPEERKLWAVMTAHHTFTNKDLAAVGEVSDWHRTNIVSRLMRRNIIRVVERRGREYIMTVRDDLGQTEFVKNKRTSPVGAMWTAIRSLTVFTTDELESILLDDQDDITAKDIRSYCSNLVAARYLKVVQKARPGVSPARYRLVRNTGPLPPEPRRIRCLVDGNEERIVYAHGVRL